VVHAQDILDAEQRLLQSAASLHGAAGDVVLGAPESVCAYRLPGFIASVRKTSPEINVHLVPAGTDETFRGLLNRRLDIGLILDDRKPLANLTARRIGSEWIDLVAARGHPAASRRVDWRGLVEFPYFLREEGCSYSDKFIDDINAMTVATPTITRFRQHRSHPGLGGGGAGPVYPSTRRHQDPPPTAGDGSTPGAG